MSSEVALVEYDKACRQLERARYVDEVAQIRDQAMMLKAAAKIAQNKTLEANAWEIRIRAERRLGEMLRDGKDDRAGWGGDRKSKVSSEPLISKPTLEENGIGKSLANKARRLAELPEKEFALMVNDGRNNVKNAMEDAPQLRAKPKKKAKAEREFKCPHCGKSIYLKGSEISGFPGNSK